MNLLILPFAVTIKIKVLSGKKFFTVVLDIELLKTKLSDNDIKLTQGLKTCLNVGVNLLKTEKSILEFNDNWFGDFSQTVIDIWLPHPTDKEKKKKAETRKLLPESFLILKQEADSIFLSKKIDESKPTYEKSKSLFDEWRKSVLATREDFEDGAIAYSNPYLTISVEDTLEEGSDFQKHAKIASSLETKWGNWGEKGLEIFNKKLIPVHAGRIDFKLGKILYDVKSGPNVLNLRDVDGARLKQGKIRQISNQKSFGELIGVSDFSVGIVYGREELATKPWMQKTDGLIIFGNDTWRALTGDEWNAYTFFVWSLRYNIEELKQNWSDEDKENAIRMFVNSFYGENESVLEKALSDAEYKKIK